MSKTQNNYKIYLSEDIHAYSYLGEPVPQVPLKTPKRVGICPSCNKPMSSTNKGDNAKCPNCKCKIDISNFEKITLTTTTTKHFRQYGLFLSISRMKDFGEMPFELTRWSVNRYVQLAMDLYNPDRNKWITSFNQEYPKLAEEFSAPGEYFHMLIKKYLKDEQYDWASLPEVVQATLEHIRNWYIERGVTDPICERAYCAPELNLAGTIDVHTEDIVDDFKTKHTDNSWTQIKNRSKQALDGVSIQIGGYVEILKTLGIQTKEYHCVAVCANKDHEDYGKYEFIEIPEEQILWGAEVIRLNTQAWCKRNRYYPYQMYKEGKCWTLDEILKGERNE